MQFKFQILHSLCFSRFDLLFGISEGNQFNKAVSYLLVHPVQFPKN